MLNILNSNYVKYPDASFRPVLKDSLTLNRKRAVQTENHPSIPILYCDYEGFKHDDDGHDGHAPSPAWQCLSKTSFALQS